jgi:four helix bundle protein
MLIVKPAELQLRTKRFALRCLKVAESLPRSITGKTIAGQLARAATSVAANYRAACRARSKGEFVAKMGIVEEEADETAFWLDLTIEAEALPASKLTKLITEADELVRIIAASYITAARNRSEELGAKARDGRRPSRLSNQQSPIANRQ